MKPTLDEIPQLSSEHGHAIGKPATPQPSAARARVSDRRVLDVGEFTDADIAALQAVRAPDAAKSFDDELHEEEPRNGADEAERCAR